MTISVDKIVNWFPFPNIISIIGQHTSETIEKLNSQLNTNASSVQSSLGGGTHVYLMLTVLPTVLATLLVTHVVVPINPGSHPCIGKGLTAAHITIVRSDHTNALKLFVRYDNTNRTLKQQLFRAVSPVYL